MLGWNGRTKDWLWDDGNKLGPSEIHDYLKCVNACSIHSQQFSWVSSHFWVTIRVVGSACIVKWLMCNFAHKS